MVKIYLSLYLPNVINIRKNMIDQKTDPVIILMASGYTTKTSPGPKIYLFCVLKYINCFIYQENFISPSDPTLSIDVFCTVAI